jgi:hypothetical protein
VLIVGADSSARLVPAEPEALIEALRGTPAALVVSLSQIELDLLARIEGATGSLTLAGA